jgi:hypothetical protein
LRIEPVKISGCPWVVADNSKGITETLAGPLAIRIGTHQSTMVACRSHADNKWACGTTICLASTPLRHGFINIGLECVNRVILDNLFDIVIRTLTPFAIIG